MAKPKPPLPPQPRAGDVVCLRQSQDVQGEIITILGDGRYRVKWETGVDYRDRITTVSTDEIRKKLQLEVQP